MNKIFNTLFWIFILLGLGTFGLKFYLHNDTEELEAEVGKLKVQLRYNPVHSGGDKIFGYRVPYDIVWRAGSGDVTEIHFSKDAIVEGKKIKAGRYSLWVKPSQENWIVILNGETGQYGTDYERHRDLYQIKVPVRNFEEKVDPLHYGFVRDQNLLLEISWEHTGIQLSVQEA